MMPDAGSLAAAFRNSARGLRIAARSERAVRQELAVLALALPAAALVADSIWMAVGLIAALLAMLSVELLNTAIEKLCDHVTPERNAAIGIVKDLGSAAALCAQVVAGLLWLAALAGRLL